MQFTVKTFSKPKYEWNDTYVLGRYMSRKDTRSPMYYVPTKSKRGILAEMLKISHISEELVFIISKITEILGIIVYMEEEEMELIIGQSPSQLTCKITIPLEDFDIVEFLENS